MGTEAGTGPLPMVSPVWLPGVTKAGGYGDKGNPNGLLNQFCASKLDKSAGQSGEVDVSFVDCGK